MSNTGPLTPGEKRTCPHCRATVLRSASVCPICEHSLRYDSHGPHRGQPPVVAFSVEGTIRSPDTNEPCEYSMVLSIKNDRGEEITRQMIDVGALRPDEARTFSVVVGVSGRADKQARKRG